MDKFALWKGATTIRVMRLLGVIAIGLVALSATMVLGRVSANTASQSGGLQAFTQANDPDETITPTATLTGTVTVSVTPAPGTPSPSGTPDRVTICHHTGSPTNPYVMITVDRSALPAHRRHGDIIPAPTGGCPALTPPPTGTASTTPSITVTATRVATGTATATAAASPAATGTATAKVTICHRTGSSKNPYVMITVSMNAIPAHSRHGDIIPAPAGGCPAVAPAAKKANPNTGSANHNGDDDGKNKGNGNGQTSGKQKDKEQDTEQGEESERDDGGNANGNGHDK
jgi:hypothetical protein